jgi:hypothetical protein
MTDVATDMLGRPTKLESMIPKLDFVFQSRVTFKPTITLGNLGGMGVRMMAFRAETLKVLRFEARFCPEGRSGR